MNKELNEIRRAMALVLLCLLALLLYLWNGGLNAAPTQTTLPLSPLCQHQADLAKEASTDLMARGAPTQDTKRAMVMAFVHKHGKGDMVAHALQIVLQPPYLSPQLTWEYMAYYCEAATRTASVQGGGI